MNVKSDWFRCISPVFGVDGPVWKINRVKHVTGDANLTKRVETSPSLLSAWLYVSSVEFAKNVGAGETSHVGLFEKIRVRGASESVLCECSDVQAASAFGHIAC